jgi:hypothetical protein
MLTIAARNKAPFGPRHKRRDTYSTEPVPLITGVERTIPRKAGTSTVRKGSKKGRWPIYSDAK